MDHRNARLTIRARIDLIQEVEAGYSQAEVARRFRVCRSTVAKWVRCYRERGKAGLEGGSCRPHRSPRQTDADLANRICALRRSTSWGPHRIGWALGIARSTVYAVLRRAHLHRRAWLHRVTREIVRYEHPAPGDLLHLDVKKLGRVPDGGGKRFAPGFSETRSGPQSKRSRGIECLHVAVDDHSRCAYVEALPNEKGETTVGFVERALAHFADRGVTIKRILTDNGANYRSRVFSQFAAAHGIRLKRTRPFRPQTNGKAEAFNKILQNEWAYAQPYGSNEERLAALAPFLTYYNHHRPHYGIGGAVPASRL